MKDVGIERIEQLMVAAPYGMTAAEKQHFLAGGLVELCKFHNGNCAEYARLMDALGVDFGSMRKTEDIPFLPVRLFKEYLLSSVPESEIVTTMTSSGTTGQKVSRIPLDAATSTNQKKALSHIIADYIGKERLPLLVLDSKKVLKDRKLFGARGAGILGFAILGRNTVYALDDEMNLDVDAVENFLEKHKDETKLLFGYTFMVWKHFYLAMKERGVKFDFGGNAHLFHSGGWKTLQKMAVDDETYRRSLMEDCHINAVHNYYGMAEQLGSVYVECEEGHLHASNFSDVIIRNPVDWSVQPQGEKGLIELVSLIPRSYPGHAILTEDEGIVLGEDDCPCGRCGKYFRILGRVKNAEIRGCSDTYADKLGRS